MARVRCLAMLLALVAGACSPRPGGAPDAGTVCVPYQTTVCHPTGCTGAGVQRCTLDGSGYGACICSDPIDGGPDATDGSPGDGGPDAGPPWSNLGFDFWPTVTMNSHLTTFPYAFYFAVAVVAPATNAGPASITITGGCTGTHWDAAVAPGTGQTIQLPWIMPLRQTWEVAAPIEESIQLANGAYHLTSTQPVAVYQFNPVESLYAYSGGWIAGNNDASLLLPQPAWADAAGHSSYIVMSRPSIEVKPTSGAPLWSPGFFAVVASQGGTQVTVTFTANTLVGTGVPQAFTPGSTGVFTLGMGEVLMVAAGHDDACTGPSGDAGTYCDLGNGYDLTGTEITSDKPVAVFGGHNCDLVPFDIEGCNHLEEQLLPVSTWGTHYIGTRAISTSAPMLWRVVSGAAANLIQFSPPIIDAITGTTIGQVILDRGGLLELITDQDFEAVGDAAFMMASFMVGWGYPGNSTASNPAMAVAVPVEQFSQSCTFLAPEYWENYLTVVAKVGSTVDLDGNPLTGFTAVGSSGWGVTSQGIVGGTHAIATSDPDGIGIQVYGVGWIASYMYPGGLNLNPINP